MKNLHPEDLGEFFRKTLSELEIYSPPSRVAQAHTRRVHFVFLCKYNKSFVT